MFYKLLFVCLAVSTQFSLAQSQKSDTSDIDFFYQNLFDSTLTESEFLKNVNGFIGSIKHSTLDVERWHSGQTDYIEVFYQDSIQTFNSERHFNSLRTPRYCSELLYRGKVIRGECCGGEGMYHAREQLGLIQNGPVEKRSKRSRRLRCSKRATKNTDEPVKKDDSVSEEPILEKAPTKRYCTETYYNHEKMLSVRFVAESDPSELKTLLFNSPGREDALNFQRKFTRLISVSYQQLSAEDLPRTPIRNH